MWLTHIQGLRMITCTHTNCTRTPTRFASPFFACSLPLSHDYTQITQWPITIRVLFCDPISMSIRAPTPRQAHLSGTGWAARREAHHKQCNLALPPCCGWHSGLHEPSVVWSLTLIVFVLWGGWGDKGSILSVTVASHISLFSHFFLDHGTKDEGEIWIILFA